MSRPSARRIAIAGSITSRSFAAGAGVVEEGVDEASALIAGRFDCGPLGGREEQRRGLEVPVGRMRVRGLGRQVGLPGIADEQLQTAAEGAQLRGSQAWQAEGVFWHASARERCALPRGKEVERRRVEVER